MRVGGPVPRSALCGVTLITSTAAACCFLIAWSYWYRELDADCADGRDCKCLLFGTSFGSGAFVGGERYVCRYAFGSTVASAALAACMCAYYGCRALLCRSGAAADAAAAGRGRPHRRAPPQQSRQQQQQQQQQLHRPLHRPPESQARPSDERRRPDGSGLQISGSKICSTILFAVMAINMFVASIVLSNGYISTCQQYVHRVKSFLMVSGKMVEMVSERMSCGTVYDFLDYLQPPSRQVTYELIHRHKPNPREYIINTSALLVTSIAMSWLSTLLWAMFTIHIFYFQ